MRGIHAVRGANLLVFPALADFARAGATCLTAPETAGKSTVTLGIIAIHAIVRATRRGQVSNKKSQRTPQARHGAEALGEMNGE